MGTDPGYLMGLLAIGLVFFLVGFPRVVVLSREALRRGAEFEGEVKVPLLFSLRLRASGKGSRLERDARNVKVNGVQGRDKEELECDSR